jgi:hypothetical protein
VGSVLVWGPLLSSGSWRGGANSQLIDLSLHRRPAAAVGWSAVPRRSSRVRRPATLGPRSRTTLYSVDPLDRDHDASCASFARLQGDGAHSNFRLAAHRTLRCTIHLGVPTARQRQQSCSVNPGQKSPGVTRFMSTSTRTLPVSRQAWRSATAQAAACAPAPR